MSLKACFVSYSEIMRGQLMRIPGTASGGAELQQVLIAKALTKLGITVDFIVPNTHNPTFSGFEEGDEGIRVYSGIKYPKRPRMVRALGPIISVIQSLRKVKADVYYQRGPNAGMAYVALYCMLKRVPFVFGCASIKNVDGDYERGLSRLGRRLFRLVIRRAAAVIVQSNDQKEQLRRNYGREGVLIRNMVDIPPDSNPMSERDIVLWVGRHVSLKRPEMFVDLAERFPDHKFVMAGGRYLKELECFEKMVERAKDIPNLELLGQVSSEEIGQLQKRALFLVSTSLYEGFPNTFLEAWSCGTPTISTYDVDGLISEHSLGYHCATLDELVQRTEELLTDSDLRQAAGVRALAYARANYHPDEVGQQLAKLLRGVTGQAMRAQSGGCSLGERR